MSEKRNSGVGIFIPLTPDEKEQIEQFIEEHAAGTPSGKFARTALFYFLHRIERQGNNAIIAEILGA